MQCAFLSQSLVPSHSLISGERNGKKNYQLRNFAGNQSILILKKQANSFSNMKASSSSADYDSKSMKKSITFTFFSISSVPWFTSTSVRSFSVHALCILIAVIGSLALIDIWRKKWEEYYQLRNFAGNQSISNKPIP